jgi:hypothetical protein
VKENKNMITDEMLVDYLLGEATGTEVLRVEQWLNENEANKKYFEQFKSIWENGAALAAVSPVNEHEAWARLQQRITQEPVSTKTFAFNYSWLRIAAMLLLFLGIGGMAYFFATKHNTPVAQVAQVPHKTPQQQNEVIAKPVEQQEPQIPEEVKPKPAAKEIIAVNEKPAEKKKNAVVKKENDCKTKQFICNGTSCPLQICIIQKSNCDKNKPYAISNCSIIEPDQSGQLCYKAKDEQFYRNCALTVEEVRITRVSTGETIVLNAHTSMTAQDFFNYITGKKKGEIVAGAFESDCDNVCNEHDLRIDNSYGGLLFR